MQLFALPTFITIRIHTYMNKLYLKEITKLPDNNILSHQSNRTYLLFFMLFYFQRRHLYIYRTASQTQRFGMEYTEIFEKSSARFPICRRFAWGVAMVGERLESHRFTALERGHGVGTGMYICNSHTHTHTYTETRDSHACFQTFHTFSHIPMHSLRRSTGRLAKIVVFHKFTIPLYSK